MCTTYSDSFSILHATIGGWALIVKLLTALPYQSSSVQQWRHMGTSFFPWRVSSLSLSLSLSLSAAAPRAASVRFLLPLSHSPDTPGDRKNLAGVKVVNLAEFLFFFFFLCGTHQGSFYVCRIPPRQKEKEEKMDWRQSWKKEGEKTFSTFFWGGGVWSV